MTTTVVCPLCMLSHNGARDCQTAAKEHLAKLLGDKGQPGFCRTCRKPVTIIKHSRLATCQMFDADGTNHRTYCEHAHPTLRLKKEVA